MKFLAHQTNVGDIGGREASDVSHGPNGSETRDLYLGGTPNRIWKRGGPAGLGDAAQNVRQHIALRWEVRHRVSPAMPGLEDGQLSGQCPFCAPGLSVQGHPE